MSEITTELEEDSSPNGVHERKRVLAKNSQSLPDLIDASNKEQLLTSPFGPALKAQEEVDEKFTIRHGHKYIPRSKPGEITREHEQYNLTYAMMIGIRHSVQSWQSSVDGRASRHRTLDHVPIKEMKKGIKETHFFKTYKMFFPPEGGKGADPLENTPPHLLKTGFKFKDYAPEVFARLRKRFEISDLDYLTSLCGSFNFLEFISNSKSGEFFFYSHDGRFLIKTQRKSESKFMRKILPMYYNYVADNPNSLLVRICGAHRVKLPHLKRRMHFVIMMSVFAEASEVKPVHRIYDLKGATHGRRANPGETVKKDLDVIDDHQFFHLGPKRKDFLAQVENDSKFLCSIGVMDYSLLVGIHDRSMNKPAGSFVFRSDRKSSLQAEDVSKTDLVVPGSPMRSVPSLPSVFSKQQVLNSVKENPSGEFTASISKHDSGALPDLKSSPPASPVLSKQSLPTLSGAGVGGPVGAGTGGEFNSFYKIDSRDGTSLLMGETYRIGIIDIFTRYSNKKRAEHAYKALRGIGSTVSAVNPVQYQARFVRFIAKITVAD